MTAPGSGAEIIPFLKTWVNLPMAIGFTIMYAKLANVLSNEALFYTVIFPFIAFFGAFAFVLYPMQDILHPTGALVSCVCVLRVERRATIARALLFWGEALGCAPRGGGADARMHARVWCAA